MTPAAYYNENDKFAAAWLRLLIQEKLIADGEVDERSIEEVSPEDLAGFSQCHFFAGIGIWSYALRCAGWPDDRPVWTGSCPCPSFSAAGQGKGFDDPRHLWPAWSRLIGERKPATVFGEQVDDAIGFGWLDLVQTDLEREAYAVGKAVFGACSVGAPQIGSRLYFVAASGCGSAQYERCEMAGTSRGNQREGYQRERLWPDIGNGVSARSMASTDGRQPEDRRIHQEPDEGSAVSGLGTSPERGLGMRGSASGNTGRITQPDPTSELGAPECEGLERYAGNGDDGNESGWIDERENGPTSEASPLGGFWRDAEWLYCTDGKYRPVEPGTFPLAHGYPSRVGTLRGYGNALCAQQAEAFIRAYLEIE